MNQNILINYIKTLSNDKKIQKLLFETIGKILLQQDNVNLYIKNNNKNILHIRDWITSVLKNKEEWKIPRVLTIDALNNAADKYFQKKNNKIQIIELDEEHEKLIADLGDYFIVQMLTPEALDNESRVMQHCIGHGYYDDKLNNGKYQYLSLRDKFNKAHATLEIMDNEIIQLQGKQNIMPNLKYLNILIPWLMENKYNIDFDYDLSEIIINKIDNKVYSIYNLPKNCEINGNLILQDVENFSKFYLYKDTKVNGYIYMADIIFKKDLIPNDAYKNDKICLLDVVSILLEKNYIIDFNKYNLIINHIDNQIYFKYDLPENCEINGNLRLQFDNKLSESSQLKNIPNKLKISGNLDLIDLEIKEIPDDLIVGGNLLLFDCPNIQYIPISLNVNGTILLYDNEFKLEELPKNLITDNKIELFDLANFLYKEKKEFNLLRNGYILNQQDNKIYSKFYLPENCKIEGNLSLAYTKIKKLPNNLVVDKLYLTSSIIEELPEKLKCKKLYIAENLFHLIHDGIDFEIIQIQQEFDSLVYTKEEFFSSYYIDGNCKL